MKARASEDDMTNRCDENKKRARARPGRLRDTKQRRIPNFYPDQDGTYPVLPVVVVIFPRVVHGVAVPLFDNMCAYQ